MKLPIQKAVVLGAGTMGARIAAHFANAGLPCVLLDMVPPDLKPGAPTSERNRFACNGLEAAKKSRPAAFFSAALSEKISIGNFEDDLGRCAEADWIIEAVIERADAKQAILGLQRNVHAFGDVVRHQRRDADAEIHQHAGVQFLGNTFCNDGLCVHGGHP